MNKNFYLEYLPFCKGEIPKLRHMVISQCFPICSLYGYAGLLIVLDVVVKGKISDHCALAQLSSALAGLTYH